ncbi:DNA/RNA non-specific endonuclease [Nocardioides sp. NPDC057767]|uniref:DNA/RNA non-specific endonuclease n=1 Tax=unclassified Nocardioides TaxID=2615069 RepID=UPI00367210A3
MKAARAALRDLAGRRAFGRLLASATLLLALLTALPAAAIDVPFDPLPIPGEDACNNLDAPIPASPHGFGSFVVKLDIDRAGRSADPFADQHPASIESVYGTSPQWFTYDNGCTGQFVAEAGTALSNILLELAGLLPNWSHALLHSVLSPSSWLIALEEPVVEATTATAQGVWSPWLPIVLLLVVVIIILRSRAGRFADSATAAAWALLVLGLSSWLMNYPLEAVHLVDDGVRGATELIATSFNDDKALPEDARDLGDESAVVAVDIQFDHIVRTTQYRTWTTGVFGNPDSATAKEYGPKVFAATHFSWEEYETYRDDPEGAGAKIVEKKADDFKTYAEQIKETDALAYDHFKGGHWSQRVTTSLVNLAMILVTCGFLLLAALATLLAYALVRLLVPFSPALGVLFMIDRTRDAAVAMLKRVAGPLVMGPICFLVGLLLLRFFAAILATDALWFVLKLGLIGVLTYVAWKLVRPQAYTVGPVLNGAFAPLRAALAARMGTVTADVAASPSNRTEVAPTQSSGAPSSFVLPYMPLTGSSWTDPDAATFVPYVPRQVETASAGAVPSGEAATQSDRRVQRTLRLSSTDPAHRKTLAKPPPESTVLVDDRFLYRTDEVSRVWQAEATLSEYDPTHPRNVAAQRNLEDKIKNVDHAGHLFARIFKGPGDLINLVPMHGSKVNQGQYRRLENLWSDRIQEGKTVEVTIDLDYDGSSRRPTDIVVTHVVDGVEATTFIENEEPDPGGTDA